MSAFDKTWITSRMAKLSQWFQEAKEHVSIQYDIREWMSSSDHNDIF